VEVALQIGKNSRSNTFWAYGGLVFGVLVIGFSAIFVRLANAPGVVSAFYRMAIGSIIMALPFFLQIKRNKEKLPVRGVWLAISGGIFFGLDLTAWTTGIMLSNATIPTLMANTAPLWVGLGALLIFRERQATGFWLGLFLALSGTVVVMGNDLLQATNFGRGAILGLLAALGYGAFFLTSQRARKYLNTLSYFWISTTSSAVVLLISILISGHTLIGYTLGTYWNFMAMGILVQVLGWMVINYVQGILPASIVAPTLLGQPVITAFLAMSILGEIFSFWHVTGGIIVLMGVYFVHRSRSIE
jgi:drug/metabolite transporter (DMT)-like permease